MLQKIDKIIYNLELYTQSNLMVEYRDFQTWKVLINIFVSQMHLHIKFLEVVFNQNKGVNQKQR